MGETAESPRDLRAAVARWRRAAEAVRSVLLGWGHDRAGYLARYARTWSPLLERLYQATASLDAPARARGADPMALWEFLAVGFAFDRGNPPTRWGGSPGVEWRYYAALAALDAVLAAPVLTTAPEPTDLDGLILCSKGELLRALGGDRSNRSKLTRLEACGKLTIRPAPPELARGHAKYLVRFDDSEEHRATREQILHERTRRKARIAEDRRRQTRTAGPKRKPSRPKRRGRKEPS